MIRIIYGNGGHSMRDVSPVKIDVRDLGADGRPHPRLLPAGDKIGEIFDLDGRVTHHLFDHVTPTCLSDGEREFDRVLSEDHLEREFPGYRSRVERHALVAAARAAAAMAGHDDEIAAMVSAGVLTPADLSDLDSINVRRKLCGRPLIGAKCHGLEPDGIAGPLTIAAIEAALPPVA